jgi:peptidoglycan/LPS O-acetylase OafA/YrhL
MITYILDSASLQLFANRVDVSDPGNVWVNPDRIEPRLNFETFFGNLLFLQNILVTPLGSNNPLWSLTNEGWYYILFPLFWLALKGRLTFLKRVAFALVGVGGLVLVGPRIAEYFTIWLLGTVVCLARPEHGGESRKRFYVKTAVGIFLVSGALLGKLAQWRYPEWRFLFDLALALAVAVLLYFLLEDNRPQLPSRYERFARTIAGFSFTLYAVHFPVLVFVRLSLTPDHSWHPAGYHLVYWLFVVFGVLALAYLIAGVTEAHTDSVRRFVVKRLARS